MRAGAAAGTLLLAACAGAPPAPPGAPADEARLAAHTLPGQATRASVLAALGPTHALAFDNGYQVWLYQIPRGGGRSAELVLLFDRDGVLRKTRRREPSTDIHVN